MQSKETYCQEGVWKTIALARLQDESRQCSKEPWPAGPHHWGGGECLTFPHLAPGRAISNCLCYCVTEGYVLGSPGAPNFLLCDFGRLGLPACFYICRR